MNCSSKLEITAKAYGEVVKSALLSPDGERRAD